MEPVDLLLMFLFKALCDQNNIFTKEFIPSFVMYYYYECHSILNKKLI